MKSSSFRSVLVVFAIAAVSVAAGVLLRGVFQSPAGEHIHKTGEFGGFIVSVGKGHYHAEILLDRHGLLKMYMRGQNDADVLDIESQTLEAQVRPVNETEPRKMKLEPKPRPSDREGRTSYFEGKLPKGAEYTQLVIAVPDMLIEGERHSFRFITPTDEHGPQMPANSEAVKELYLTPGGAYTEADIEANGRQTAAQKYANFKSEHDLFPKPGDPVCPITQTKANAACVWIIGGKTYTFCCPPCIDEFVKLAKNDPEKIAAPEVYVKK